MMFVLWYQMRFGRSQRERLTWLVTFMSGFYTVDELLDQERELENPISPDNRSNGLGSLPPDARVICNIVVWLIGRCVRCEVTNIVARGC